MISYEKKGYVIREPKLMKPELERRTNSFDSGTLVFNDGNQNYDRYICASHELTPSLVRTEILVREKNIQIVRGQRSSPEPECSMIIFIN
jgi:hypothetical protein